MPIRSQRYDQTRRLLIGEGLGSVFAVMGMFHAGIAMAFLVDHYINIAEPIHTGISGLDTILGQMYASIMGLSGAYMHRISTFALRDTVSREQWCTWTGAFVGRNEYEPSWFGFREEWRKIQLMFKSWMAKKIDITEIPKGKTRASEHSDPWQLIGGVVTLRASAIMYIIGFMGIAMMFYDEADFIVIILTGMVGGTMMRSVTSIVILNVNVMTGILRLIRKIMKICFANIKQNEGIRKTYRSACDVAKQERILNNRDWKLVTTRVLTRISTNPQSPA